MKPEPHVHVFSGEAEVQGIPYPQCVICTLVVGRTWALAYDAGIRDAKDVAEAQQREQAAAQGTLGL